MVSKQGYDYKKTLISTTGLVVLFLILILVNVIFSYANIRWDLTEDNTFSLSEATHNILAELSTPVTVKFFCSRSIENLPPNFKAYAKRIREFLSEYEHASKGMVTVEMYDPKIDSDEEEWAQKYGMGAMQNASGEKIYCGLVFLAADQEKTIEWLDPGREGLLEYEFTSSIHGLQTPERKVVGLISNLPVFGTPRNLGMPGQAQSMEPWFFVTELQKTYEVQQIFVSADRIDPSVDLLLIFYPKDIHPDLLYAIDQYVLSGGNLLVFIDPLCLSDNTQRQQMLMRPPGSSLDRLFEAWGISMDSSKIVADLDQPTRVRTQNNVVENNPVWISARGNAFSESDVITSRLETMLLPAAGAIKKAKDCSHEFVPMVQSGKNAGLINMFKANQGADAIRSEITPSGERFDMAVRVRGKFKTAFPEGPLTGETSDTEPTDNPAIPQLKTGKKNATIIVVADADMLADRFFVQRNRFLGQAIYEIFNDNLNFLSNACEILTGGDDLIGIRSRGKTERPFTKVLALERRAQERWLAKEKELVERAEATNQRLQELEQKKDVSQSLIISPEQEAEIAKFREEKRAINRELKEVRKNLRSDIETLGTILKGTNIFLMPLLVSIAGIGFALYRQKRIRKR